MSPGRDAPAPRDGDVDAATAAWLVTEAGFACLRLVTELRDAGATPLAIGTRLRRDGVDPHLAAAATSVAAASRRAHEAGLPAGSLWTTTAAEQASHPVVAAWRARRLAGRRVVDATAGCGADALALADHAREVVAVERDGGRVVLLGHNLRGRAPVVQGDALRLAVPSTWDLWADPGRRSGERRLRRLGALQPPVPTLLAANAARPGVGVAVLPGVAHDDPDLPADCELEFLQVGPQLVEATLWLGALRETGPGAAAPRSATLLPEGLHRRGIPGPSCDVAPIDAFVLEPAPALVRARLHDDLARELGLARLARNRALFTSGVAVASPWLRAWRVEDVVAARPKAVRAALRALDELPLEISLHGHAGDPAEWLRRLDQRLTGPNGRRLLLVRRDRDSVAVLAQPVDGVPKDGAR